MSNETEIRELFEEATKYVRTIAGQLDSEKLLYLYARFKQANEGECNTSKPGFFDFQGKQKWEAWKKLGNMSKQMAMLEYMSALTTLHPEWTDQLESGGVKEKAGLGVTVSTFKVEDEVISDEQKTVFDWCKDGNVQHVTRLLTKQTALVNTKDENGMALLHWACDRGYNEMVELLLGKFSADVNVQDEDGQTSLHYAVSCEHLAVIGTLLTYGIDRSIEDSDGESAGQTTQHTEILKLLAKS